MFGGDKAFWGVESLFNVGSFFVVWRKAERVGRKKREIRILAEKVRSGRYVWGR